MFSVSEMPIVLDSFELERCLDGADGANSDKTEIAHTESWSPLPLPQKFPARSSKAQDSVSKSTSRRLATGCMAKSRRAIGIMINLEEAARWSCSDEDIRYSASTTAGLIIMHDPN
jgi:hypothetical protein